MARASSPGGGQLPLFGPAPDASPPEPGAASPSGAGGSGASVGAAGSGAPVGAALPSAEVAELAARLPAGLHLGGSTWSFPGWAGLVYDRTYSTARLGRDGLAAYARHPLLRAAGIDRTHYRPLPAADFSRYAAAVPPDFLFLIKAHETCTLERWPDHARYGAERGGPNPLFLDPAYAATEVVGPYAEGLGSKGAALLFQFAPQDLGPPRRFAERLHAFLTALPRGPRYAVELRNRELLTADYAAALAAAGACHCLTVHPRMPDVRVQAHLTGALEGGAGEDRRGSPGGTPGGLVVGRWLLGSGATYEAAARRFAPFNRLAAPDRGARCAWADLARQALAAGRRFLLTVNNNAEGCAPLGIVALVRELLASPDAAHPGDPSLPRSSDS
jgi:uncharacterized protein YecE (DUF72 family)